MTVQRKGLAELTLLLTRMFPLWAVVFTLLALKFPQAFAGGRPVIVPLLGVVMFGMGMTLSVEDFKNLAQKPVLIGTGVLMQFLLMPLIAWILTRIFSFRTEITAGIILLGAAPGGTASNVICYLARGNVALSIALTTTATLLAPVLTPALTWLYMGRMIEVPVVTMFVSILKIIILPVFAGVAVNTLAGRALEKIKAFFPLTSVFSIVLIIAIIVGMNRKNISDIGALLFAVIILHNALGLAAGYWLCRLLKFAESDARAIAIEVGMQNSGLSVALAIKFFGQAAALPGALFSIWHNLSGSLLAAFWSKNPPPDFPRKSSF